MEKAIFISIDKARKEKSAQMYCHRIRERLIHRQQSRI